MSIQQKRNTIKIIVPVDEPDKLLEHFKDVVSNIPNLRFDIASIHQRLGARKSHHAFVLHDKHIDVIFMYGKNEPIPTSILVTILKLAGFDRPQVFEALEKNPLVDVLIWGNEIAQY